MSSCPGQNFGKDAVVMSGVTIYLSRDVQVRIPDFTLKQGEIKALVGRNGSGKTTALTAILGLVPSYSGQIEYFGRELVAAHPAVPVNDALGVQDFLGAVCKFRSGNPLELAEWCGQTKIDTLKNRLISRLSTGQRKKVELIAALISITDCDNVLLLDEPTNGLDEDALTWLADLLRELQKNGTPILMCSHDDEFLDQIGAERINMTRVVS